MMKVSAGPSHEAPNPPRRKSKSSRRNSRSKKTPRPRSKGQNREIEYYVTDYNTKPLPGSPRVEYSRYSKTSKTTLRSTASNNDWNSEWKPWAICIFLGVLIIIIIIGSKDNVGQFKGTRSVLSILS
jgi:hypothetical protein